MFYLGFNDTINIIYSLDRTKWYLSDGYQYENKVNKSSNDEYTIVSLNNTSKRILLDHNEQEIDLIVNDRIVASRFNYDGKKYIIVCRNAVKVIDDVMIFDDINNVYGIDLSNDVHPSINDFGNNIFCSDNVSYICGGTGSKKYSINHPGYYVDGKMIYISCDPKERQFLPKVRVDCIKLNDESLHVKFGYFRMIYIDDYYKYVVIVGYDNELLVYKLIRFTSEIYETHYEISNDKVYDMREYYMKRLVFKPS